MKRYLVLACLLLSACAPTPMKVNEAIGRGQLQEAVLLLSDLLNSGGDISARKLDSLLEAFSASRHFTLDIADELFDRLNPEARNGILRWYIQQYLQAAEAALQIQDFERARMIWLRHQKVRQASFPDFQEATPVMGIIYLREAEYWADRGEARQAREAFVQARQILTRQRPFDRIQQYNFVQLAEQVRKKIK
jgi:hypothetical protein